MFEINLSDYLNQEFDGKQYSIHTKKDNLLFEYPKLQLKVWLSIEIGFAGSRPSIAARPSVVPQRVEENKAEDADDHMSMLIGRLDSDRRETAIKIDEENKEGRALGRTFGLEESGVEFDQYRYSETNEQELSSL